MLNVHVYQSKVTNIKAVLVTKDNLEQVAQWCGGYVKHEPASPSIRLGVVVPTINGDSNAFVGHYVIQGPNDFYPCDPDTFESRWKKIV